MTSVSPPQGMSEVDYEAIEAAVTETVRGRWFLAEFARRNRLAETRQLLDAMARLEAVVTNGQPALPSADPSIRLLIQRIKEIAGQLGTVAGDMRAAGVEEHLVEAVALQARAVSGMMRSATPSLSGGHKALSPQPQPGLPERPVADPSPPPRLPRADMPSAFPAHGATPSGDDPRFAALASVDALPLADKLALFR